MSIYGRQEVIILSPLYELRIKWNFYISWAIVITAELRKKKDSENHIHVQGLSSEFLFFERQNDFKSWHFQECDHYRGYT